MRHVNFDKAGAPAGLGLRLDQHDAMGAGMDLGVRHLAAVAGEDGCESLHDVSGGCKRYDGDRIDKSRSEQGRRRRGSGRWNKTGHKMRRELKRISSRQRH